jgi:hypothetical protein
MKFYSFIPSIITTIKYFIPEKLQGHWYQVATNDPTIPHFCKNHTIEWKLASNKKDYYVKFLANCTLNVTILLHGTIKNGTLYENFNHLPKIHKIDIVNIKEENNTYQLMEAIGYLHFYNKRLYQLWTRTPLPICKVKEYIKNATEKYNVTDIKVTY